MLTSGLGNMKDIKAGREGKDKTQAKNKVKKSRSTPYFRGF